MLDFLHTIFTVDMVKQILKVVEVDGEEQLSTLDSEEELELVYQKFMDELFADEEE